MTDCGLADLIAQISARRRKRKGEEKLFGSTDRQVFPGFDRRAAKNTWQRSPKSYREHICPVANNALLHTEVTHAHTCELPRAPLKGTWMPFLRCPFSPLGHCVPRQVVNLQ